MANVTANLGVFVDEANISDWASDAVQWGVANSIIAGKEGNLLDPKGQATRAEIAAIITRFIEKF